MSTKPEESKPVEGKRHIDWGVIIAAGGLIIAALALLVQVVGLLLANPTP